MATERRNSWVKNYEAVDFDVALERDAMLPASTNALASTSEVDLTAGQQQQGTHASYHPLSSINPPLPINGAQHMPAHSQTDTHPSSSSSLSPGPSQPNSQATTPGPRPLGSNPNLRNSTASKYHQRSSPLAAASYPSSPTSASPNLITNPNTMEKPTSGATAAGSNPNPGPETQSHPLLFPGKVATTTTTTTTSPPPPVPNPATLPLHPQLLPSPPSGHARPTMSSFGASTSSSSPPPGGPSLGRPGSRGSMILYRVADPFSTPAHSAPGTLSRSSTSGLAALAAEQQHLTTGGSGALSPVDPSSSSTSPAGAGYTPPHPAFFQNSHGSRSNRASTYSMSGDSIVSFASDSKYPAHNVMAGYGGYSVKSPLSPPGGSRAPSLRMSGLNALGGATPGGSAPGTPGGLGTGSTMSGVGPGTLNYKGGNQLNIGIVERGLVAYVYDPDEDEDDSDEGSDWEGSLHGDEEDEEAKRNSKVGGAGGGSLNSRKALTAASMPSSGKGKPAHHPSHPPYKPKSTFLSGRAWLNLSTLLILLLSILALFILYPVITFGDASGRRMELITGNTRINGSGQAVGDGGDVPARGAQAPVGITTSGVGTGTATGTTSTTALVVNTQTQTTTSTSTTPVLVNTDTDTATSTSTDTSLVTPTDTTTTTPGTTDPGATGGTDGTGAGPGTTLGGQGTTTPPVRRGEDNGGGSAADPIRRLRKRGVMGPVGAEDAEDAAWVDEGEGEERDREFDTQGNKIHRWTEMRNGHLVEYASGRFPSAQGGAHIAHDDPLPLTQEAPSMLIQDGSAPEPQPLPGVQFDPVINRDAERIRACVERIKGKKGMWMVDGKLKAEMAREVVRMDVERAAAAEMDVGVPADADVHADYEVEGGWVWIGADDVGLKKRGDEEDWRANVEVDKFGRAIKDEESWRANVEVDKFGRADKDDATSKLSWIEVDKFGKREDLPRDRLVKRDDPDEGGQSRDDPGEGGQRRDDPDEGGQRRGYEGDAAERLAWIEVDKFGRESQAGYEGDARERRVDGDYARSRLASIEVDKFGRGDKDEDSWRANVEVDKFGRSGGDVERSGGDVERRQDTVVNSRVMRNVQAQPEQNANRW